MDFQEYTWFVLSLLAFPWYVGTLDKTCHFTPGILSQCQGNISQTCGGNKGKSVRWLFVYTLYPCLWQLRRTEADLYNSPYLACKKITFQLLPLCYDICWACRCLTQAWGEVQGVKIKEVLSPSDSNSTGPTGQASNVGLKLPVDVGLLHRGGRPRAQPLPPVQSLLRPKFRAKAASRLWCIKPCFCWCKHNFLLHSQ